MTIKGFPLLRIIGGAVACGMFFALAGCGDSGPTSVDAPGTPPMAWEIADASNYTCRPLYLPDAEDDFVSGEMATELLYGDTTTMCATAMETGMIEAESWGDFEACVEGEVNDALQLQGLDPVELTSCLAEGM